MTIMHIAQKRDRAGSMEALCGGGGSDNLVYDRSGITCWRCAHLVLGRALPAEPALPEHNKLRAAKEQGGDATQLIGEFIEWLERSEHAEGAGLVLAEYSDEDPSGELYRAHKSREALIADFFGINQNALSAEKDALLAYQRAVNAAVDWFEKEARAFLRDNL